MTMSAVKHAIATNLKSEMPGDLVTNAIAPLLNTVNEWSTQIPAMLEGGGSSSSANLIFAIRKELFVAPAYTQCVLGTSPNNLPASFGEFLHFIQKLIEAQKSDKDPVATKVNLHYICFRISAPYSKPSLSFQASKRPSRASKFKPVIDDEEDHIEITSHMPKGAAVLPETIGDDVVKFFPYSFVSSRLPLSYYFPVTGYGH